MRNIASSQVFADRHLDNNRIHSHSAKLPLEQTTSNATQELKESKKTSDSSVSIKEQLNTSILQSNLAVSVNMGNEPMALLYKAALAGINDVLKDEFGDNAIQNAYDSGLDISPEATADRIVTMSTGFFSSYLEQNPDMSEEEAAKSFADIISGGVDRGFAEAREILDGLQVLEGDIASNIDVTYEIVQKGLQEFIDIHTEDS